MHAPSTNKCVTVRTDGTLQSDPTHQSKTLFLKKTTTLITYGKFKFPLPWDVAWCQILNLPPLFPLQILQCNND